MIARRLHITIHGQVQGVGFRPHIWNCASALKLTGFVRNDSNGVIIEVEGPPEVLDVFQTSWQGKLPPLATIDQVSIEEITPIRDVGFLILESSVVSSASTPIAPDVSTCDDCLREMFDPRDRRYRYPFINCTNCGPRFTIIQDIPYDRPFTTMHSFAMCAACQAEYDDPSNRRFHAQPNACPECGPAVWFVDSPVLVGDYLEENSSLGDDAISAYSQAIKRGAIVATQGIGGFHLACDAFQPTAIARLRQRKGRIEKPFAVMVRNIETAAEFVDLHEFEQQTLQSVARPIVLLRKQPTSKYSQMLDAVAPGNEFVGVMLPYSPLHFLIMENHAVLVMTSGNLTDEPIVRTHQEASQRLQHLADSFLLHNRDIHSVCDDSVVRCVDGHLLPIRRSRGYAPMPIRLSQKGPCVLAVGGELKAAFCVTKDNYAYLSQHVGDVGNLETLEALRRYVEHFLQLYRIDLEAIAGDAHPNYLSSQWAQKLAHERGVPFIPIQHHAAHAYALVGEHSTSGNPRMLACCLDGTGYGDDGTIWGGEFLTVDSSRHQRWGHLESFPLPGGDASIKRPYRVAMALLQHFGLPWDNALPAVAHCPAAEQRILRMQLEKQLNCVSTSSFGRLFDAVASLIGVQHTANYEAQAAMELEAIASQATDREQGRDYQFSISDSEPHQLGIRPVLQSVCHDVMSQVPAGIIAARFHHAVADAIVRLARLAAAERTIQQVGLTGGVFQNTRLTQLTSDLLRDAGFEVLVHSRVPPNDGGIALGQAVLARRQLQVDRA